MARNNRDRLIETFLSRNRRRTPGGPAASFQPAKQGTGQRVSVPSSARFSRYSTTPPNRGQEYVSQGRAVENAANAQRYSRERAQGERERSQAYYRHKLGYDKPGITVGGVKRKAKKVVHKINPFD